MVCRFQTYSWLTSLEPKSEHDFEEIPLNFRHVRHPKNFRLGKGTRGVTSERALLPHSQPWSTLQVAEGVGDGGARGLDLLLEGTPDFSNFRTLIVSVTDQTVLFSKSQSLFRRVSSHWTRVTFKNEVEFITGP